MFGDGDRDAQLARLDHDLLQVDRERIVGHLKSHVVDADPERDQPRPGPEGAGDLAFERSELVAPL